jgi:hypothetical protein
MLQATIQSQSDDFVRAGVRRRCRQIQAQSNGFVDFF